MLQEVIDRIAQPGKVMLDKLQGLLFDATIGLFRDYQKKTLELVKITAASCYLQSVKALRQAAITLFLVTLASVVFSVALVVIPVAVILVSPWSVGQKIAGILAFGLLDISAALVFLYHLFSEERWMKITQSQKILNEIKNL